MYMCVQIYMESAGHRRSSPVIAGVWGKGGWMSLWGRGRRGGGLGSLLRFQLVWKMLLTGCQTYEGSFPCELNGTPSEKKSTSMNVDSSFRNQTPSPLPGIKTTPPGPENDPSRIEGDPQGDFPPCRRRPL